MSVKTLKAWVDRTAVDIEVTYDEYVAPTQLLPYITLLGGADHWLEYYDENNNRIGYYQTVTDIINGAITMNSRIDLQPSPEQLAAFHEKDVTFTVINEDGIATVYAVGVRPERDYTIQCSITEVAING